jgi:NADH dehydrogenase (ubiquinone) 1 alpha subcomplex subunit 6
VNEKELKERGARDKEKRATAAGSQELGLTMTMQAPEIQTMYSLNMPVSTLRTKMRQEFERHRYVNQLKTVDVLLFNSHQEFQVHHEPIRLILGAHLLTSVQETLNFWKQLSHVLKYFRAEEDPKARLPNNFINGFLEVR